VHGVDSTHVTHSGEREFGPAAAIDYDEVVLRWMDHYLRAVDNGMENEPPVRYFVMGENQWHIAKTWPPPAHSASYYLQAPSHGNRGTLGTNQTDSKPASFTSDPSDPVINKYSSSGAHDYRELADRKDVLTFDSGPLDHDLEVTGPIHVDIFLSCDCRDLDLWARLLDVAPDGTAFNLMSPGLDVQRASYRNMGRGRQLLHPGKIYEIHLNDLITSNAFEKGHRIRVQISGTFFPNFSRNPQTGKSEASSAKMKKAKISIYTDRQHASHIELPVITM
jgi:putative CocE/NonD family hydrolase